MSYHRPSFDEILSNIVIDHVNFQVTWNPYEPGSCILWYRDSLSDLTFTALGKFSKFEKRTILEFVARYLTSDQLRSQIRRLQFDKRLAAMNLNYFEQIELLSYRDKERAYRNLFSLDSAIGLKELAVRRRSMAKRFHPDAGGDNRAMTIINEAYDYLAGKAEK